MLPRKNQQKLKKKSKRKIDDEKAELPEKGTHLGIYSNDFIIQDSGKNICSV